LALPIALAQLGMVSMSLVDTAVVGRVSVDALASVALGRAIFFAATSLGMGVSFALEPLASQAVGAREPERAWAALAATLRALVIIALPSVALTFAVTFALVPMGIEAALIPGVRDYLIGLAPGLVLFFAFLAGKTFLQAHSETRPVLIASVLANVVNLVGCNLLVRGDESLTSLGLPALGLPQLGPLGAGLTTSIGNVVLAAVVFYAARAYRPRSAGPPVPLGTVFRLGTPVGLQLLAETGIFALASLLVGRFGARIVSAHQIALSLASFTFMGALGVGGATAVRVGHAIGASISPRRPGLLGLSLGGGVMSAAALVFALFPRLLMRLFTPDADVIEVGASLLYIAAVFQLFDGLQGVATGALRGAGDVRFPFLANIAAHWLVGFPVAIGLGFGLGWGAPGIWWGLTAGLVSISLLLTGRFWVLSRGIIARVQ